MAIMHGGRGEESIPLVSVSQPGPVHACLQVCECTCMYVYMCGYECVYIKSFNQYYIHYENHTQIRNSYKRYNGMLIVLTNDIYVFHPVITHKLLMLSQENVCLVALL